MNEESEIKVTTPLGTVEGKGRDIKFLLQIAAVIGIALILAMLNWHVDDNKALVAAIRDLARSQREWACVQSLSPEKREKEYLGADSYCRRFSAMP